MKTHTNTFKENIKKLGRELDSQISYTLNNEEVVLGKEQLNAITPHYEGDILKSVMKQLDIDSNVDIPIGTKVNYKFGVKTRSGKNLYNPTFRRSNDTIYCSNGSATEKNGIFTLTATGTDLRIWEVQNVGNTYNDIAGQLFEFNESDYSVLITNNLFTKNYITFYDEDKVSLGFIYKNSNTFTISKNEKANAKYFAIRVGYGSAVSGTSYSLSVQLEEGNTSTEYEDYGMYDYLDYGNYIVYSSEKQEDTRSYKIVCYDKMLNAMKDYEKIENKNLFDVSKWNDIRLNSGAISGGSTFTLENGELHILNPNRVDTFTVTGIIVSGNLEASMRKYAIELQPNTTYTFSFDIIQETNTNSANSSYYNLLDENYNFITIQNLGTMVTGTRHKKTFTTTENTKYLTIRLGADNTTTEITYSNIMLEEGNTATNFAPPFEYPITLKNYLWNICSKIDLDFKNTNFVNYNKTIENELYLDSDGNSLDYTYRDVLDEIAGATASTICINEDDELEVRYIKEYKLPSGYSELDYIQTDGISVINTNVRPSNKIDMEVDMSDISTTEQFGAPFGWRNGNTNQFWNYIQPGDGRCISRYGTTGYNSTYFYTNGERIKVRQNSTGYYVNGQLLNEYSSATIEGNNNIYIFATNNNGTTQWRITAKLYSAKIYDDNVLIRDFIPALRTSDNKVGLYDIVNDVFYLNQGASAFTYGQVVNESVDLIDEEYLKDINVNFGEKYGPVNSIVFSRSAESDNIYRQDDDSIEENGLHEIKIKDNQILNSNNRDEFIDGVFNQLNGFEYYANDFSSTGIAYYDLCDRYNVRVDNNIYSCIMMNDELNVTQGLEEQIHTDIPEDSETDYKKADKTDRRINETWIIANKQEGYIQSLTSRTTSLEENTYTITQVNDLIQNAESGITNTFSEAGGNNIFRNTGLWFDNSGEDSQQNPYEFWTGIVVKTKEENASNMNALLLQNNDLVQEQIVPNGFYTISFKYKKLLALATPKVYINNIEYSLSNLEETEFVQIVEVNSQHINIKFTCSENGGCEIYDLMVNAGQVKLAYSQNQNETTTSTVNISKGITITSSDLDVTFKANADGIRTLDRSGNVITKFTDTGMTTEEATINAKSSIVGTLWQEVNGQTWITRL